MTKNSRRVFRALALLRACEVTFEPAELAVLFECLHNYPTPSGPSRAFLSAVTRIRTAHATVQALLAADRDDLNKKPRRRRLR